MVVVLSTVQIVSWGVPYYALAALRSSITADTGRSGVAVTGAFSLSQLVAGGRPRSGRRGAGAVARLAAPTAPALVAGAAAPFVGAMLADLLGSYAEAFLVLAGLAALAAVLMAYATPRTARA